MKSFLPVVALLAVLGGSLCCATPEPPPRVSATDGVPVDCTPEPYINGYSLAECQDFLDPDGNRVRACLYIDDEGECATLLARPACLAPFQLLRQQCSADPGL